MFTPIRTPAVKKKKTLHQSFDRDRKYINQTVSGIQRSIILKWYGFVCSPDIGEKMNEKQHLTSRLWNATGHIKPNQSYINQLLLLKVRAPNLNGS